MYLIVYIIHIVINIILEELQLPVGPALEVAVREAEEPAQVAQLAFGGARLIRDFYGPPC